jgi:hypothetical protein
MLITRRPRTRPPPFRVEVVPVIAAPLIGLTVSIDDDHRRLLRVEIVRIPIVRGVVVGRVVVVVRRVVDRA